jgi:hypothetical protein
MRSKPCKPVRFVWPQFYALAVPSASVLDVYVSIDAPPERLASLAAGGAGKDADRLADRVTEAVLLESLIQWQRRAGLVSRPCELVRTDRMALPSCLPVLSPAQGQVGAVDIAPHFGGRAPVADHFSALTAKDFRNAHTAGRQWRHNSAPARLHVGVQLRGGTAAGPRDGGAAQPATPSSVRNGEPPSLPRVLVLA